MKYSIIVPVYNRPGEVDELLRSLTRQACADFEVVVVDDGSSVPCSSVCSRYAGQLDVRYYAKPNSGPGQSRNYGAERSSGEWLVVLDSDVVVPDGYLAALDAELEREACDAFGGPDAAHPDFTVTQKAISYAMTSFFTTGGIRGGGARRLDRFFPRSYNMGVRREVWQRLGGFRAMRFGEDIDFSYRLVESGCRVRLFPEAWVWHKRRATLRAFFRQVYNSGVARIHLEQLHPHTLKAVHALPAVFTAGCAALVLASAAGRLLMYYDDADRWRWLCLVPWLPIALYALLILADATHRQHSLRTGAASVAAAFTQLTGYGSGFLCAAWQRYVLRRQVRFAFQETFYDE